MIQQQQRQQQDAGMSIECMLQNDNFISIANSMTYNKGHSSVAFQTKKPVVFRKLYFKFHI